MTKKKSIADKPVYKEYINDKGETLKYKGRMLVRKSGTEPKIRIMGESDNKKLLFKCINIVKKSINKLN